MAWFFVMPGHQKPCYWLCKIKGPSLVFNEKEFKEPVCREIIENADVVYVCSQVCNTQRNNSLRLSEAYIYIYIYQWNESSLGSWLRTGDKPLYELIVTYCSQDNLKWFSMKFESKYNIFHTRKWLLKCRLQNGGHFVPSSMWMWNKAGQGNVIIVYCCDMHIALVCVDPITMWTEGFMTRTSW